MSATVTYKSPQILTCEKQIKSMEWGLRIAKGEEGFGGFKEVGEDE